MYDDGMSMHRYMFVLCLPVHHISMLGEGRHGTVREAIGVNTDEKYAIKIINKGKLGADVFKSELKILRMYCYIYLCYMLYVICYICICIYT